MIETTVITSIEDLEPRVIDAWDRLAVAASLPYSTPAWMGAFWREYHEPTGTADLRLVVVRDGSEVVGIGPFYAGAKRPLGLREWWPLGAGIGQRTGPLASLGREQDVARALGHVLAAEHVTALRLPAVDSSTPWNTWLSHVWPARPRPKQVLRTLVPAPQVLIRPDGDYEAWFGQRSRNFHSEIKRRTRLTAGRGGHIRRVDDPGATRVALGSLFALHRKRLTALGRRSHISTDVERAVAAGTAELMTSGRARIWVVEAAGEIVAADVHLIAGSRMCCYNGGIDPGWEKESLGSLLLDAAVRDAHALGCRTLDLGAGDQYFKGRFADGDAPLVWSSLVPRGPAYPLERARFLPSELGRAARGMVDRLPPHYRDGLRAARRLTDRRLRPLPGRAEEAEMVRRNTYGRH